jgi:hypothetical protein
MTDPDKRYPEPSYKGALIIMATLLAAVLGLMAYIGATVRY